MDEHEITTRVRDLVDQEKSLRQQLADDDISVEEEQRQLAALEVALDQCWDLLRQRRALSESGGDPDQARVRPAGEVEGYLQ